MRIPDWLKYAVGWGALAFVAWDTFLRPLAQADFQLPRLLDVLFESARFVGLSVLNGLVVLLAMAIANSDQPSSKRPLVVAMVAGAFFAAVMLR